MRKCRNLDPFRYKILDLFYGPSITHEIITSQQQQKHKKKHMMKKKEKLIKNIPSFMSKTAIVT